MSTSTAIAFFTVNSDHLHYSGGLENSRILPTLLMFRRGYMYLNTEKILYRLIPSLDWELLHYIMLSLELISSYEEQFLVVLNSV